MTATSSRDHSRSPSHHKRKRSESASASAYATPRYDGAGDDAHATYQYAYDDDGPSDAERSLHTPNEHETPPVKRLRLDRPTRLNYVPCMTMRGHTKGVAQVKFSPDGKHIASCSADATIKVWSASTGRLLHTFEGHLAGVSTIAWSPDSKVIASGSDDKIIRLWDMATGQCLPNAFIGHHNYVYSLAFSPKGNMLVSGSYDEAVFLWDVRTARIMRSLPAHSDPVSGVDFVRDGTLVVSCSSDGLIRIWDTSTGQCLKTLVHEDNAAVTSVRFSPNGKFVLAATLDSCVRLWNHVDGRVLKTYQGHENVKFSINTVFGSYEPAEMDDPESAALVKEEYGPDQVPRWAFAGCGSEDGEVLLWDVNSKEVLQNFKAHDGVVLGLDVRNEDQAIITCGVDKAVTLWKRMPLPAASEHDPIPDRLGDVSMTEAAPPETTEVSQQEVRDPAISA